ncbi:MAG TPA: lysophospholipid transporter LplT [Methylophilaceae bacterium]|nr:lysophospholipid transporter LplT [Methylophilaceae bacterium]
MNQGFYTILAAQFLSALADNALLFAAIAMLARLSAPDWHTPLLQQFFVYAYIVLAPFVGPFADALPKGRVMFISNAIKFLGCLAMLLGMQPLYAYGIVGIGAAAYSPAKYGILTEYLPPQLLVKANAWMEGSTVIAIILGIVVGTWLAEIDPSFAIKVITGLYLAAAVFNLYIPKVPRDHRLPKKNPLYILHDFWHSLAALWRDRQGQVSLAVTTLFWGAGATLKLVVLVWAVATLGFSAFHAGLLIVAVALGIAAGSILASRYVTLEKSFKVLPAGIVMGLLVMSMVLVSDWRIAALVLFLIGAFSGYFVVPLNALLQHRGHILIGAGHSIAVQNFNENLGILLLTGAYLFMVKHALSINWIVIIFGAFISLVMAAIYRTYRNQ